VIKNFAVKAVHGDSATTFTFTAVVIVFLIAIEAIVKL